jgi:RNA polymerase sigma-70 factor (ECF subfamily)
MSAKTSGEWSTVMSSPGRIESEHAAGHEELKAATGGDLAARWRVLEACRDYLRLVVRRGRWSNAAGLPATSDLVQGTVVDAWRQFSKFRGRSPGELRAWLKAMLIHASLNARRRPGAAPIGCGSEAGAVPASGPSPSQAAQAEMSREALDAALGGLAERHRTVIHLRVWDRLSFAEIGVRMEVSEDAARMMYGRALAKLRESMRPGHDPG